MRNVKKTLAMLVGISFLEGCVDQSINRPYSNYVSKPETTPIKDKNPTPALRGKYNGRNFIPQKYKLICEIYPVQTL